MSEYKAGPVAARYHFNRLTEAEQERLVLLVEECNEVSQIACKILRHGYTSTNNSQMLFDNRALLASEIGHALHAIDRLISAHDIDSGRVDDAEAMKRGKITPYLHHQV